MRSDLGLKPGSDPGPGRVRLLALSAGACVFAAGCGIAGPKDSLRDTLLSVPSSAQAGCLKGLGPTAARLARGEADDPELDALFDCASDTLTLFERFVRPADAAGYSPAEIHALLSRFLFDGPVRPDLVTAAFSLKASLLGGHAGAMGPGQLGAIRRLLAAGRIHARRLRPLLWKRLHGPSPEELAQLADAVAEAGRALAVELNANGARPPLPWPEAERFVRELTTLLGAEYPGELVPLARALKSVLIGGSDAGWEPADWPRFLGTGAAYAGLALALSGADLAEADRRGELGPLVAALLPRARAAVEDTLHLHGGALPVARLELLVDAAPATWFSEDPAAVRPAARAALRPLLRRLFGEPPAGGAATIPLDPFRRLVARLADWATERTHLDALYPTEGLAPESATDAEFARAASRYLARLDPAARAAAARGFGAVQGQAALPWDAAGQIDFTRLTPRGRRAAVQDHLLRRCAELLMEAYGSDRAGRRARLADLRAVLDEFGPLALAVKLFESPPGTVERRFREANLFLPASDGDDWMSLGETTDLLRYIVSELVHGGAIRSALESACGRAKRDPIGWRWMDPACFRREWIAQRHALGSRFPAWLRHYDAQPAAERARLDRALELASRRHGISEQPVGGADVAGYTGVLHYLESLFLRFDADGDEALTLPEIRAALPVFRTGLAEVGGLDPNDTGMLEAVLTYTLKYGEPPTRTLKGITRFLWWRSIRPFWRVTSRRGEVLRVLAGFSPPLPIPPGLDSGL